MGLFVCVTQYPVIADVKPHFPPLRSYINRSTGQYSMCSLSRFCLNWTILCGLSPNSQEYITHRAGSFINEDNMVVPLYTLYINYSIPYKLSPYPIQALPYKLSHIPYKLSHIPYKLFHRLYAFCLDLALLWWFLCKRVTMLQYFSSLVSPDQGLITSVYLFLLKASLYNYLSLTSIHLIP